MKKNFQIFWIKFRHFIENPFYWNVAAAILNAILGACYIWQGEIILAVIWILCFIMNIWLAWMNRNLR